MSLTDQVVDRGAHERYRLVAISTPSHFPRHVRIDERSIPQVVSLAFEHVADLGQKRLPPVTIRSLVAVHQRDAQRHPGERQRHVIAGSFGDP